MNEEIDLDNDIIHATIKNPEPFKIMVDGQEYSLEEFNKLGSIVKNLNLDESQKHLVDLLKNMTWHDGIFESITEIINNFDEEMKGYGIRFFDIFDLSSSTQALCEMNEFKLLQVLLALSLELLRGYKIE